jgi:hypothetical protein
LHWRGIYSICAFFKPEIALVFSEKFFRTMYIRPSLKSSNSGQNRMSTSIRIALIKFRGFYKVCTGGQ